MTVEVFNGIIRSDSLYAVTVENNKTHIDYYRYKQQYKGQNRRNSHSGKSRWLKAGASLLFYIFQVLILLKRFLTAFFVFLLIRPLHFVLRLIFYKLVVPGYSRYLSLLRRLGWKGLEQNVLAFFFHQKLVHVLVVVITIMLIAINLAPKTKAVGFTDKAQQTILAELIKNEFEGYDDENERLIVETFDQEAVISPIQQNYLDNLGAFRPQPRASLNDIAVEEESLPTIQGGTSIVKPDLAATRITKRARTETVEYKVQPGDTISTIAQEFEVSVSTILWENNKTAYSIIRPGETLRILPVSGVSHEVAKGENIGSIAKKYDVEENVVMETNELKPGDTLKVGQVLLIPGGRKVTEPQYTTTSYTGFSAIRDIVTSPSATPVSGNKMNWPTVGSRITQYYSWRHTAVDIANKVGTPIYAADAGTIEVAGWGTGYGNQIVIDHGGGKKTRYAHLSKFYVEKGDTVTKGQTIAAMGSTGWSTGPHVHFEVIINGVKQNPLNYIKY